MTKKGEGTVRVGDAADVGSWHITSFHCGGELVRYQRIADIDQNVPINLDLWGRAPGELLSASRLICPTGSFAIVLSSPPAKNILLRELVETAIEGLPSRTRQRGVSRSSRTLGAGCGGRGLRQATNDVDPRTAKSCGPDAPTLASSRRSSPPATVARKPGHRGEREASR